MEECINYYEVYIGRMRTVVSSTRSLREVASHYAKYVSKEATVQVLPVLNIDPVPEIPSVPSVQMVPSRRAIRSWEGRICNESTELRLNKEAVTQAEYDYQRRLNAVALDKAKLRFGDAMAVAVKNVKVSCSCVEGTVIFDGEFLEEAVKKEDI